MQTFLPYADFYKSAISIDKKRCWKQVIEAKQILGVLKGLTTSWKNHPAVKMWMGYEDALTNYYNIFLKVSKEKYRINTKLEELPHSENFDFPWWVGNESFHRAMRSRLIEKHREHYESIFQGDKGFNNGMYLWPVNETMSFRIIKKLVKF